MSTPSLKERQHQLREEAILDTAETLLIEQGYDGLTMDELAHRVGIAKATLYQHFPSKGDVMVGVVTRMMTRGEEILFSEAASTTPPLEKLRIGLKRALTERMKVHSWKINTSADVLKKHERFREHQDRIVIQLTRLLEAAQRDGEIDPNICLPVAATTIAWLFRIDYDAFARAGEVGVDRITDTIVRMVINGLRNDSDGRNHPPVVPPPDNSLIEG